MNKVMLVGRLTRDPELRSLPSGKHVATFTVATNDFRGGGERTEYHPCVAWVLCTVDAYLRRIE
jgi:single-strand DNA-binding protein